MFLKLSLFAFLTFAFINMVNAQQNTSTSGLTIVTAFGNISYTIGQLDYISTTNGDFGTLSEGVQQVYNLLPYTYIVNIDRSTTLSVWPNPVIDYVYIKVNRSDFSGMSYQVMNMNGQLIENKRTYSNNIKIDTHNYIIGAYVISVNLPNQPAIQFKIIKQ